MAKASPLQSNFNGGEFSPLAQARVDLPIYKNGVATCLNYIPTVQGPLTRRPGTKYVAATKDSSKVSRLVRFEFSTTQAYIIEFGDLYCRFYKDGGQILSLGSPYEVVTTYAEADLFDLNFVQSADTLYITHRSYPPKKLTRSGHTSWTLSTISFIDGPFLNENTTTTTLSFSATSGSVTVTASSTTGINNNTGFQTTDVGRLIRASQGGASSWLVITARASTTSVTATVMGANVVAGSAFTAWRLGVWGDTNGYPAVATFHEDRLCFAGSTGFPQRIDMSNTGDYEVFSPTGTALDVSDNRTVSINLNSTDVNAIRWLLSTDRGLLAGTVAGEWVIAPSVQVEAIAPNNAKANDPTSYGSAAIAPVKIGKSVLFVQRSKRKVREMKYSIQSDGIESPDRTVLAEHVTGASGIKQLAYQKDPQSLLWAVRNDGVLAAMTYNNEEGQLIAGWFRNVMGGYSDAGDTYAKVESIAIIPSTDGTRDEVWVIVKRWIDGATRRYVEYLTKIFEDSDEQKDAFFVDCGLTYDSPITISGATRANPVVVTATSHGLSNGNAILISDILGMEELNGNTYTIANVTTHTFELQQNGSNVNGTSYGAYVSGGEARKYVTTITGLSHLEGQQVSILADGAALPIETVASGAITLASRATTVHVGLGYNSDGEQLRQEAGSVNGSSIGNLRRTHRVAFVLHRSLGLKIGTSFDSLTELTFRTTADALSRAPALFSGIRSEAIEANYDFENKICWRQSQPLPSTILAIAQKVESQDAL